MNVLFQKAKNNEETALINNTYIHSNYNPSREAERFVSNLTLNYKSKYLIITEPGLSYCVAFFKEKFPDVKIGCIRYLKDFENYNTLFDFSINYYNFINPEEFEFKLCSILNEEDLLCTTFIKWEPACKLLQDIDISVWTSIKNSFDKSKTLLITRQYFEKKWFYNSILYFKYINSIVSFNKKITVPVFIISSGPSLNNYLKFIEKNQNKVFLICLSSAISVCLKNNIIPDLIFSTDGGYWAGQHLKKLYKYNIPLALPAEGFCPKKIFNKISILPINYMDGLSSILFNKLDFKYSKGKRNGTVSGTALEFAIENSNSNIYFFGLDLSNQKGFQHSQPNELYLNGLNKYNHINSEEKNSVISEYSSGSLNIYCNWFKNFVNADRKIFRVIDSEYKHNSLRSISDINLTELSKHINNFSDINKKDYFINSNCSHNKSQLIEITKSMMKDESVKKLLYPLDFIHYFHENDSSIIDKINTTHKKLENKIWKLLND